MKKLSIVISFILLIISVSCAKGTGLETKVIQLSAVNGSVIDITVEIADTDESRAKGFMGRQEIPEGTGMLFVFEKSQMLRFWMKDTPHPLSIAFIDSKGVIQNIYDMTPFSQSNWSSTGFVQYALEVPQGWFEKVGIKEGDYLILDSIK